MVRRSDNCSAYTDSIHILVEGKAHVPGRDDCNVTLDSLFSCQTSALEKPDDVTANMMIEDAKQKLEARKCDISQMKTEFQTVLVGAQEVEYSGEKLAKLGLASNCYRGENDINDATHVVRAECRNEYEFVDAKGNRVRDSHKKFLSNLRTCDVSEEAMPQLMEDARKVAAHNASINGYKVQRDTDLACQFSILPQL